MPAFSRLRRPRAVAVAAALALAASAPLVRAEGVRVGPRRALLQTAEEIVASIGETVTDIYDTVVEAVAPAPDEAPDEALDEALDEAPAPEPLARRRALLDDLGVEGAWSAHPATHAMALEPLIAAEASSAT